MMAASSCQVRIADFLSAAEFWLDIVFRCYYAICGFLLRAGWIARKCGRSS